MNLEESFRLLFGKEIKVTEQVTGCLDLILRQRKLSSELKYYAQVARECIEEVLRSSTAMCDITISSRVAVAIGAREKEERARAQQDTEVCEWLRDVRDNSPRSAARAQATIIYALLFSQSMRSVFLAQCDARRLPGHRIEPLPLRVKQLVSGLRDPMDWFFTSQIGTERLADEARNLWHTGLSLTQSEKIAANFQRGQWRHRSRQQK